jgi:hypothetical protein
MRSARPRAFLIWVFALGYFACYAPYSALTKALTDALLPGMQKGLTGFELLPSTALASLAGMFAFLTAMRWWRHANHRTIAGVRIPAPTRWTFASGLCTAAIIGTTTLAYTFDGVSIVFVMLLMRGGVLVLAPVIDTLGGRKSRWFSWVGLGLSLASLVVAFSERGGYDITLLCAVDVALYLASYFVRLRFMTKLAKSPDPAVNRRFFVEEQMVATPALVLALGLFALVDRGELMHEIRAGFVDIWSRPVAGEALLIGLLSQGTGVFGGLVLLDPSENTYSVPVNRCSSMLAGVLASYGLSVFFGSDAPSGYELAGAALIVVAILFLTIPPALETRLAPAPPSADPASGSTPPATAEPAPPSG